MFKTDSFLGNKKKVWTRMFGVIIPLCNRMFCCIFGWYFYFEMWTTVRLHEKKATKCNKSLWLIISFYITFTKERSKHLYNNIHIMYGITNPLFTKVNEWLKSCFFELHINGHYFLKLGYTGSQANHKTQYFWVKGVRLVISNGILLP